MRPLFRLLVLLLAIHGYTVRAGKVLVFQMLHAQPNSHSFLLHRLTKELTSRDHEVMVIYVPTYARWAQLSAFAITCS
jgi:hypothetical protein